MFLNTKSKSLAILQFVCLCVAELQRRVEFAAGLRALEAILVHTEAEKSVKLLAFVLL